MHNWVWEAEKSNPKQEKYSKLEHQKKFPEMKESTKQTRKLNYRRENKRHWAEWDICWLSDHDSQRRKAFFRHFQERQNKAFLTLLHGIIRPLYHQMQKNLYKVLKKESVSRVLSPVTSFLNCADNKQTFYSQALMTLLEEMSWPWNPDNPNLRNEEAAVGGQLMNALNPLNTQELWLQCEV